MKEKYKILLVDDEQDILDFLKYNFEKEGFVIFTALDGLQAIEVAKENKPDLIVLDVMMPHLDGMETCSLLRELPEFKDTLIIFLTARNEDYSEIAGFNAGADDYVTKPIRPKTLIARVQSLLKRKQKKEGKDTNEIRIGRLTINLDKRIVLLEGKEIFLPKKEFKILTLLASKPEYVFTREEIYSSIWGSSVIVGDRTLDVHIRKLRKNIGNDFIKTHKGIGYAINVK